MDSSGSAPRAPMSGDDKQLANVKKRRAADGVCMDIDALLADVDWLIAEVERLRGELEVAIGGYEGAQQAEVEARTLLLDIRTQLYRFFAEEQ